MLPPVEEIGHGRPLQGPQASRKLGNHPAADNARLKQQTGPALIQTANDPACAVHDTLHVGQEYQAFRSQSMSQLAGNGVSVDVERAARMVRIILTLPGKRSNHWHVAAV